MKTTKQLELELIALQNEVEALPAEIDDLKSKISALNSELSEKTCRQNHLLYGRSYVTSAGISLIDRKKQEFEDSKLPVFRVRNNNDFDVIVKVTEKLVYYKTFGAVCSPSSLKKTSEDGKKAVEIYDNWRRQNEK